MNSRAYVSLQEILHESRDGDWGKSEPEPGYVPVHAIRGTDFAGARLGRVSDVPLRYFSEKTANRRILQPDDILIETAGGSKNQSTGRTLLITAELLEKFQGSVSCASFARFLRMDRRKVNPQYIYWFLQGLYISGGMWEHQVQHTGVARLQYTAFSKIALIPNIARVEQDAIAEVLGALDDKIAVNDRIADLSLQLGAALFAQMQGCERVPVSEIVSVTMGQSPPSETYNDTGEGIPFYQGNRDFGVRFPSQRIWCVAPTRFAEAGDVLLSVRAPVGAVNVAESKCGIGRGVASLRSTVAPHVLFYSLLADKKAWEPYESEGTVFGSINKKQLMLLEISWPLDENVAYLESRLETINKRADKAIRESKNIGELRDTLLPRLMSGEIRVKDAERIVEDVT